MASIETPGVSRESHPMEPVMTDRYIDHDETQIHGDYAAKMIRKLAGVPVEVAAEAPEQAARVAWLQIYTAARSGVECVLRLTGRLDPLPLIFYDLAVPGDAKVTEAPSEPDVLSPVTPVTPSEPGRCQRCPSADTWRVWACPSGWDGSSLDGPGLLDRAVQRAPRSPGPVGRCRRAAAGSPGPARRGEQQASRATVSARTNCYRTDDGRNGLPPSVTIALTPPHGGPRIAPDVPHEHRAHLTPRP